jgi:hypothetical protein
VSKKAALHDYVTLTPTYTPKKCGRAHGLDARTTPQCKIKMKINYNEEKIKSLEGANH